MADHSASGSHQTIYENPNGFPMANGKTLHMDMSRGDLANRIVTVGAVSRAKKIAANFDQDKPVKTFQSSRGFDAFTGYYHGVEVSVVAIGMGVSMMDFFVREARAIIDGPMVVVRYGTCGGIAPDTIPGSIAVASEGSGYVARNPDFFGSHDDPRVHDSAYLLFNVAPADAGLSAALMDNLAAAAAKVEGAGPVVGGVNITADSFYSSQGRIDDRFHDDNHDLFTAIHHRYPRAISMEMETFVLLHLARSCKLPIRASAAAMVVANRTTNTVADEIVIETLEVEGGRAVLETVATVPLEG